MTFAIQSGIYLLKLNNRNTRTKCGICSKLTVWINTMNKCRLGIICHLLCLQNKSIVDVWLDSKYPSNVLSLPLTTTMRTTSFPQPEDKRLVLKFSKSKSNTILTNFQFWLWQYSIHACFCLLQLQRLLHLLLHAHVIINSYSILRRNWSRISMPLKSQS